MYIFFIFFFFNTPDKESFGDLDQNCNISHKKSSHRRSFYMKSTNFSNCIVNTQQNALLPRSILGAAPKQLLSKQTLQNAHGRLDGCLAGTCRAVRDGHEEVAQRAHSLGQRSIDQDQVIQYVNTWQPYGLHLRYLQEYISVRDNLMSTCYFADGVG